MQKLADNIYILLLVSMTGSCLLVMTFMGLLIRHHRRQLKQRQDLNDTRMRHQKDLLHAIIASQEEERKRIGQALHDHVGKTLINLSRLMIMGGMQQSLDEVVGEIRDISHSLFPPAIALFGLDEAVSELCDTIHEKNDLRVHFANEASAMTGQLEQSVSLSLYRVIQELLINTIRHADAKDVYISLTRRDGLLLLYYRDDGRGFDPVSVKTGMGLYNIESRLEMIGAFFELLSAPGKGFEFHAGVAVSLPVKI